MNETDILSRIPSEYVSAAARSLPDAATATHDHHDATVELPDRTRVHITFRRLSHKKGRARHWYWSAIKATPAD